MLDIGQLYSPKQRKKKLRAIKNPWMFKKNLELFE